MRLNPCPYPNIPTFEFPSETVNLDMGCALKPEEGFLGVDLVSPKASVRSNLENPLPFRDHSVGFIRASHICEHLENWFDFMDECHRILKEGEYHRMFVSVPRPDHWTAWSDPEHVRMFHPNHFMYLTPFWYYPNGHKKWEVLSICWCEDREIRCLLRPIKSQSIMDELLRRREAIIKEQGSEIIVFDGEPHGTPN